MYSNRSNGIVHVLFDRLLLLLLLSLALVSHAIMLYIIYIRGVLKKYRKGLRMEFEEEWMLCGAC